MQYFELSMQETTDWAVLLAKQVAIDFQPDCVAYLAKGGYIPGMAISRALNAPPLELRKSRSTNGYKRTTVLLKLPRLLKRMLREVEIRLRLVLPRGSKTPEPAVISSRYPIPSGVERILLVDDSLDTGESLSEGIKVLSAFFPGVKVKTAVLNEFSSRGNQLHADWALKRQSLLSLPSSRDNQEYEAFCALYEVGSLPERGDRA